MKDVFDIWPGDRVEAWDTIREKNRPGTVVRRYGKRSQRLVDSWTGNYPDLVDVKFDGGYIDSCDISRGHFTNAVRKLTNDVCFV